MVQGRSPPCAARSGARARRTAPWARARGWCPAAATGPAAARTASARLPSARTHRAQPFALRGNGQLKGVLYITTSAHPTASIPQPTSSSASLPQPQQRPPGLDGTECLRGDSSRARTPASTSSSTLALPRPSGRWPMSISAAASSRTHTCAMPHQPWLPHSR